MSPGTSPRCPLSHGLADAGDVQLTTSLSRGYRPRTGPFTFATAFRRVRFGLSGCSGAHVLYVGGYSNSNSSNSLNYGLSYFNANNSLSNSNANIGGRLTNVLIDSHNFTVIWASPKGGTQEKDACWARTVKGAPGKRTRAVP